jgi:hypothetical protein
MNANDSSSAVIAEVIYKNYPDSDLLAVDEHNHLGSLKQLYDHVTGGQFSGDTLFRFIVTEVYEGAVDDDQVDLERAVGVMERAELDVLAVRNAIEKLRETLQV